MGKNITHLFCAVFIIVMGSSTFLLGQSPAKLGSKYKVIINHEEQYSIWLSKKSLPAGWKETEIVGNRKKCQNYIEEVWTDMRPLSIRKMNLPAKSIYQVVINHEEQYSILPIEMTLPRGWKKVGVKGGLDKCSEYIEEVWTDMRPLSLRKE